MPSASVSRFSVDTSISRFPPITSGLVGLYDFSSWTGSQWQDVSGNGNHATSITGTISTAAVSGNGSSKTINCLSGGTSAGLRFPSSTILPSTYTLFHVTRYTGGARQRIITGVNNNWLSGHWGGAAGVAYHEGWLTDQTDRHVNNWVLSTDQNSLYRSNGVTRGASGGSASTQLSVNRGAHAEYSDWNCATVIVYNRTLTAAEYGSVESWLSSLYGISI